MLRRISNIVRHSTYHSFLTLLCYKRVVRPAAEIEQILNLQSLGIRGTELNVGQYLHRDVHSSHSETYPINYIILYQQLST